MCFVVQALAQYRQIEQLFAQLFSALPQRVGAIVATELACIALLKYLSNLVQEAWGTQDAILGARYTAAAEQHRNKFASSNKLREVYLGVFCKQKAFEKHLGLSDCCVCRCYNV